MTATPLLGDRAAFDTTNYPELHSSDLPDNPVHHVPAPGTAGNTLISDGSKWVTQAGSGINLMVLGTREGELSLGASPLRFCNKYGAPRQISEVYLTVSTAPTGSAIICDVLIDGVSIFASEDRPSISASNTEGGSSTITSPTWDTDSILTWEISQIGSTLPGEDLVIHIVHA